MINNYKFSKIFKRDHNFHDFGHEKYVLMTLITILLANGVKKIDHYCDCIELKAEEYKTKSKYYDSVARKIALKSLMTGKYRW